MVQVRELILKELPADNVDATDKVSEGEPSTPPKKKKKKAKKAPKPSSSDNTK